MARKSMQELLAQVASTMPDNNTGAITPAVMRTMLQDFIFAIAPAYGSLGLVGPNTQSLGPTPVNLLWSSQQNSDASQITVSMANGTITRAERGTSTINFTADFTGTAGRTVSFILYKNGVATTWRTTSTLNGSANPVSVAFTGLDYADPAAQYSMYATCEIAATAVALSNMTMVLSIDPVNSYV